MEIMTAIELRYLLNSRRDYHGEFQNIVYSNKGLRDELLRFQNHVEFFVLLKDNYLSITLRRYDA